MFNNPKYVQGDQSLEVPAHLNFGKFMLDNLRQQDGDTVAFENAETGGKITYKELTHHAVNLAVGLTKLGVKKGDVVALGAEKTTMFVSVELAAIFTGATFTSYEIQSGRAVLQHKLNVAKPKYFICSNLFWKTYSETLKNAESIESFIAFDSCPAFSISVQDMIKSSYDVSLFEPMQVQGQVDTALILYSSGTTGMPKGVQLTHLNCILNSRDHEFRDASLKTIFLFGELYHNYDFFFANKMVGLGKRIVYVTNVTPENFLNALEKCKVNVALIVPSTVAWLAKAENAGKYAIDALKIIYSRSSPLHWKTMERVKELFPSVNEILQGYGMTESGELSSENWGTKGPKAGSVGKPSPGITLKVVHPQSRQPLGPNERGEICLRGPVFMKGYVGVDPCTYLDEEGFFKTGDLGYYDEDEYFFIVDRMKEIIPYDGYKVAPLELETVLLLHPGVREAGVVGKPVPVLGELPTAFVVKQQGVDVTEAELLAYVAQEVSWFMQLRGGVRFITEMPRSPRGKILRRHLREMLNQTNLTV